MSLARPACRRSAASLAVMLLGSICACAGHKPRPPADVPSALVVPGNVALTAALHGSGVQIYACLPAAQAPGHFNWVFQAPAADLAEATGKDVGRHYAGPTWEGYDGSKVVGEVIAKDAGPNPGTAVPWLLVRAQSTSGKGIFGKTAYIQRLHTVGGLAPTEPCDAGRSGQRTRVPYSADYYFYARRR